MWYYVERMIVLIEHWQNLRSLGGTVTMQYNDNRLLNSMPRRVGTISVVSLKKVWTRFWLFHNVLMIVHFRSEISTGIRHFHEGRHQGYVYVWIVVYFYCDKMQPRNHYVALNSLMRNKVALINLNSNGLIYYNLSWLWSNNATFTSTVYFTVAVSAVMRSPSFFCLSVPLWPIVPPSFRICYSDHLPIHAQILSQSCSVCALLRLLCQSTNTVGRFFCLNAPEHHRVYMRARSCTH